MSDLPGQLSDNGFGKTRVVSQQPRTFEPGTDPINLTRSVLSAEIGSF